MSNGPEDLDPADLHLQDLAVVARALAEGRLSAVALTRHMLERIASRDGDFRAFQCVLDARAIEIATRRDAALAAGEAPGCLHGVPIAIKDLLDLRGFPNTAGSPVYADGVSDRDADVVRRLEAAGAVILGKVKLTEGAFSHHHPAVAAPLNPWDAARWTGVSSSGSGVATAARLCFGAVGTDTGGSIRFPSAACGLVGLKPTYGRVSRRGAFPLGESLDHIGPMTRSVEDAALMFTAMAGYDPLDPNAVDVPAQDWIGACAREARGLRIGYDRAWATTGVEPQVVAQVERGIEVLSACGVEVVDVTLPDASELVQGWAVTCAVEAALAHGETFPARRDDFGPVLAALLDLGHRCSGLQYAELERAREHYRRALDRVLAGVDALVLPAMPMRPPRVEDMDQPNPSELADPITFTAPFDYSGHPTLTVPTGVDADGMPGALQLVGRSFDEATLFTLGAAFEARRGPLPDPLGL